MIKRGRTHDASSSQTSKADDHRNEALESAQLAVAAPLVTVGTGLSASKQDLLEAANAFKAGRGVDTVKNVGLGIGRAATGFALGGYTLLRSSANGIKEGANYVVEKSKRKVKV